MKVLYIDLETSPNIGTFWRPGSKVFVSYENILEERQIILASYAWNNEAPKTIRWEEDKKSKNKYIRYSDKNVVKELVDLIHEADLVVGQNHMRFDIPWLRGRAMKHGIKLDHNIQVFDTLKKSQKYLNLNCNKLDYLGKFFLDDEKIATGYGLWLGCINGDAKSMNQMDKYCKQDIKLLRKYYTYLQDYVPNNNHVGVMKGHAKYTCPVCGTHDIRVRKEYTTKAGAIRFNMSCAKGHNYVIPYSVYKMWMKDK